MGARFFGQFVVDEGIVDTKQLQDALELMYWVNRSIGELAAASGYMSRADAERIRRAQLGSDQLFGQLAIEAGYLDEAQVRELLGRQRGRQLMLGDALVELGFIDHEELGDLLARYELDQAPWTFDLARLCQPLAGRRIPQEIIALTARAALRTGRMPVKFGEIGSWTGRTPEDWVVGSVRSAEQVHVALISEPVFARALADHRAADVYEALTYFLESLITQACPALDSQLEAPAELPEGGVSYELVSVEGRALLIFA